MTYRRCTECGYFERFQFYNPDSVYCEYCGHIVGTTDKNVRSDMAALQDDTIIHADSGEVLANVEWDDERVTR